jgi:dihydrolipoamide dehydrogenase
VDRTHVVTDAHCRTGVEGLYAIGDLAGAPWLAHKASHEGVMVAELIAGGHPHAVDPAGIAGCTYCHPQVASVGMTEEKARAAGYDVRVGRFPFVGNGKAIALGEPEGMVKTVFDAKTGALLGAHMVGAEVTELIQGYVIGRQLETTEEDLMQTVFPHPTLSEMMHESVLDAWGRAIHF